MVVASGAAVLSFLVGGVGADATGSVVLTASVVVATRSISETAVIGGGTEIHTLTLRTIDGGILLTRHKLASDILLVVTLADLAVGGLLAVHLEFGAGLTSLVVLGRNRFVGLDGSEGSGYALLH